jgi:hypothetical protein
VFSFLKANISEYLQILKEYISKRIEGKLWVMTIYLLK